MTRYTHTVTTRSSIATVSGMSAHKPRVLVTARADGETIRPSELLNVQRAHRAAIKRMRLTPLAVYGGSKAPASPVYAHHPSAAYDRTRIEYVTSDLA